MASAWMRCTSGFTAIVALACLAGLAGAVEIGQIKTAKGKVTIERDGRTLPATARSA